MRGRKDVGGVREWRERGEWRTLQGGESEREAEIKRRRKEEERARDERQKRLEGEAGKE